MNYTDHYNSDYMMKLRHIGAQLIEDKEFEQKLNEKLANVSFGGKMMLLQQHKSNSTTTKSIANSNSNNEISELNSSNSSNNNRMLKNQPQHSKASYDYLNRIGAQNCSDGLNSELNSTSPSGTSVFFSRKIIHFINPIK